ncbi:LysR family transcriptional regulator [Erwinia sp. B116]|uniref:LysR family transcriptional regulator n=1 Tax=Erwinia sp. B116 TaxID=1561024 RepID=UPI000C76A525|nr:LysR family transcriptional regulator [Erwinia sp. B116]
MINTDRLNGIRAFVQAAQAGGFSLAAEQLGLSRSTVGKAVARLEARLQVTLFLRTTRTLSLTSEGRQFYQDCVQILANLDAAENRLTTQAQQPSGRLRVAAPPLFGEKWVMPQLLPLTRRWPGLALEMLFSVKRIDLASGGTDLAIRIGDPGPHNDLTARLLGQQRLVLCASADYFCRLSQPATLGDLRAHAQLGLLERGRSQPWLLRSGDEDIHWQPADRLRFSSMSAVCSAALAGYGIAQLPRWLVGDDLASGRLVEVLAESAGEGLPVYAVWLKTAAMPQRLRVAIDTLMAALSDTGFRVYPPSGNPNHNKSVACRNGE